VNFSYILKEEDQKKCSMKPKALNKGDAIFFDAYEPHSSSPNTSDSVRLAMKVVFRNGSGLFQVSQLIDNPAQLYPGNGKSFAKRVASQLFRSKS